METLVQVNISDVNIKDTIYYYTVGRNFSDRNLRFRIEVYGVEMMTMKPINIATVNFSPLFKDAVVGMAHFAIYTVTGAEYSDKKRRLKNRKIRVWEME